MRKLLARLLITALSLGFTTTLLPGFRIEGGREGLVLASLFLLLLKIFLSPLISLFLLPLNLVSFGAFGWLTSVFVLAALALILPQVKINAFIISGTTQAWLPETTVGPFWTIILASALFSLSETLLRFVLRQN